MNQPVLIRDAALTSTVRRVGGRPAPPAVERMALLSELPVKALPSVPAAAIEPVAVVTAEDDAHQQELQAQTEAAAKQGYEDGYAEGRAAALDEGRKQQAKHKLQVEALLKELAERFELEIDGMEELAVAVTFAACRKILGDAVGDAQALRGAVRAALAAAKGDEVVTVRLAAADLDLLNTDTQDFPELRSLHLMADAQMPRGGCVLEIAGGSLDARIDTQMRELARVLAQAAPRLLA